MNKEEENIVLAKKLGLKIVQDLSSFRFVKQKKHIISYAFAKKHSLLVVDEKDSAIIVAHSDPINLAPIEELKLILQKKIQIIFAPISILKDAIEKCYHQKEGETKRLFSNKNLQKNTLKEEGYDLLESDNTSGVIRMLNAIITEAIQQEASDIHFEPQENGLRIRYRIDGCLLERETPSLEFQNRILTRIKVLAKLDIAEKRLPQDGRMKLKMGPREIDFRVSTIPVVYGERIVLRILDRTNISLGLDRIGMQKEMLDDLQSLINLPEGIILVTGPTGSGKTTTLYSAIMEINSNERNIMTIEDPVEYKLLKIAQIGVNTKIGLHFSTGLRHILRQDPDIIMVGEIRDSQTAEIAIGASLTGHLVLSTLHTNDAPSAITRLVDMGIEPYLLTSSLVGVVAQRLVRKICPKCSSSYVPTDDELKKLNFTRESIGDRRFYRANGCDQCFQTGYKGRHGIYQVMKVSPAIKKQIMKNVDSEELKITAKKAGMKDLLDHGKELVLEGITTSSEVLRVVKAGV